MSRFAFLAVAVALQVLAVSAHVPVGPVVWGANANDQIWIRQPGSNWEQIPGGLKVVSVGGAGVWGVNR